MVQETVDNDNIKRGSHEWLKETITINEGKERLKLHK
jgi:hypothetical protein